MRKKGHRDRGRGTLVIDRQFRGLGRLKRASGTADAKVFKRIDAMLTTLYRNGRIDILQLLAAGKVAPLQVLSYYDRSELDRLPTIETMLPLDPGIFTWVETYRCGDDHRSGLNYAFRGLLKGAKKSATIADLPALLKAARNISMKPRMFNRTRSAAQAYLSDTLGRSHMLYRAVSEIRPLKVESRRGSPITVARARVIAAAMGDAGPMLWSMAMTGMGPKEYWGPWNVRTDRVHVEGTKRAGRVRDVPWVGMVTTPTVLYAAFRRRLLVASTGLTDIKTAAASPYAVTPYDLRRTFANWMEGAGIPRTRRKLYLGHGAGDVTDLYERHEIEAFLTEDGNRLKAYIGVEAPGQVRLA